MRMFTVVAVTAVLIPGAASSAAGQGIELELGLTGGYNRTDWTVEPAAEAVVGTDLEARNTFSLGGFAAVEIASGLALQAEALYTRRGTAFRGSGVLEDGEAVTFDAAYETAYVQMPLLVRVSLPAVRRVEPFLLAGPAVAFEWGSRVKGTASSGGLTAPFEVESDDFKGTDLGVVVGAGIGAARDGGRVYLNVRYEVGLSSILEPIGGEDPGSVKNRALGVLVGFSTPVHI